MKATRWILLCLLAFGLGTGAALAVNPPTVGIPSSTASQLSGDLAAVKQYAAEGRCTAVRSRLEGAQSRITKLPASTNTSVVSQLQDSLGQVRTAATAACQEVADAQLAADQKRQEAEDKANAELEATTPTDSTPTATTPDTGVVDGGPDPGTGEGSSPPEASTPFEGPDTSSNGGAGLGGVEQEVEAARQRWIDRIEKAADKWNRKVDKALNP